jgi:hypothetical protein
MVALCGLAWSQSTQTGLTTIQDTLFKADGTRFNGTLTIQWSTFDATNIGTIVQQSKSVQVANGNLYVQLVPNAGAAPPANVYSVQYQSDGRQQFTETWTVGPSTQPLTVSQVRIGTLIVTGTPGSSSTGTTPIPESSVTGLVDDLNQRPMKGVGFGTNGVAIVDDSGALETAVGQVGSCVMVDGHDRPVRRGVTDFRGRRDPRRHNGWHECHLHPGEYSQRNESHLVSQRGLLDRGPGLHADRKLGSGLLQSSPLPETPCSSSRPISRSRRIH